MSMIYTPIMTMAEKFFIPYLEKAVTDKLFGNHLLYNQYHFQFPPNRSYTTDFAFPDLKLNIEIDGNWHRTRDERTKDIERDSIFEANGWTVVRIADEEVIYNPQYAIRRIVNAIKKIDGSGSIKEEPEFVPPPITNSIMELEL